MRQKTKSVLKCARERGVFAVPGHRLSITFRYINWHLRVACHTYVTNPLRQVTKGLILPLLIRERYIPSESQAVVMMAIRLRQLRQRTDPQDQSTIPYRNSLQKIVFGVVQLL